MYYLIMELAQPYPFLVFAMAIILLFIAIRRIIPRRVVIPLLIVYSGLVFISMPMVSYFALGSLEWKYPPHSEQTRIDADAVVVLGAGVLPKDSVRNRDEPAVSTTYRCLAAAEVYHEYGPLPVLVEDGKWTVFRGPSGGGVMKNLLMKLGVSPKDIHLTQYSSSTFETAVAVRRSMNELGIEKVVLVTDASHMHRSVLSFRKQSIEVVPVACFHRATDIPGPLYCQFLPDPEAAKFLHVAVHEWLGLAWYWLHDRI